MSEIVNRVANSSLMTLDLEEIYPKGQRVILDISSWLYEGLVLREKEFRASLEENNWEQYQDKYVAINCSSDAIIPGWAFMLVAVKLQPYVIKCVQGNLEQLETSIFQELINRLDISAYENRPVIVKGCANRPIPPNAYLWITTKLIPIAKSVMYGEACSSVPLFKKR